MKQQAVTSHAHHQLLGILAFALLNIGGAAALLGRRSLCAVLWGATALL